MNTMLSSRFHHRVSRQEFNQVRSHADRAYTGTTTTVRHGKRLVQIQMANISSDRSGICQTTLSIHISTIHIEQSSILVNDICQLFD